MSQLHLSLLGAPIVQHGEQTLSFSTRKALALLIYLTIEKGRHTRKALSEAFWPELDAEHGRSALRSTLLELRRLFEHSYDVGEQAHLQIERDALAINQANSPLLDLSLLEAANKQMVGVPTDERYDVLFTSLEQATLLVRGPFLSDFTLRGSQFFDDWVRQQREYWHLHTHRLFDALSRLYEKVGAQEQAVTVVNRWLHFDPLTEEGYRRLMRLRFALGDRVGALRAYTLCCKVLNEELQIQPEPKTIALATRLRQMTPICRSSFHIFNLPGARTPARLLDIPLWGRRSEFCILTRSYQQVHAGQPHFVLLHGECGTGKTRLASEFVGWAQTQGAIVLTGRALQVGSKLPYQPFIDVLRHRLEEQCRSKEAIGNIWLAELADMLPELRDWVPALSPPVAANEELGPHRIFEAITHIICQWAARDPLVIWLDDMQWSDTRTLDLLLYLSHRFAENPVPVLLLLSQNTDVGVLSDPQSTWLQALKKTRIALTTQVLTTLTREETRQFVVALPWSEQPSDAERSGSRRENHDDSNISDGSPEDLIFFVDWLYAQTQGLPFSLVETLKKLLEREIVLPLLQRNGDWKLEFRRELLVRAAMGELIPTSIRDLICSRFGRLSPQAWNVLVAAAVLGTGLTFERLCWVAQIDEQMGLQALEELIHCRLLCETKQFVDGHELDAYKFPGEMIREVVYEEVGATRLLIVQRRLSLITQTNNVQCRQPTSPSSDVYAVPYFGEQQWLQVVEEMERRL